MSHKIDISIQVDDDDLIPVYSTEFASGADARAAIADALPILPGHSAVIPTGIKFDLPQGYEIQVRPRSGFAVKNQVTVLNTPGTVDADYRGEVCVILINHGKEPFIVTPKMRIAQLVVAPVVRAQFVKSDRMSPTQRGEGRFGHTGAN